MRIKGDRYLLMQINALTVNKPINIIINCKATLNKRKEVKVIS